MKAFFAGLGILVVFAVGTAAAVPPAYYGPMGNPEEPAMRPYKWFFHGIKAIMHHPVTKFNQANSVYPGIGTLEAWRGAREGAIDFGESAYHGLICSIPPESNAYKETGKANAFIDGDPLLSTVADLPTLPLKAIDPHPAALRERMELVEKHAQKVREARRLGRAERAGVANARMAAAWEGKEKKSLARKIPSYLWLPAAPVVRIEPR